MNWTFPDGPQMRCCPIGGHWVILAPERAARPIGLAHAKPAVRIYAERADCPFCPGREHETPEPVLVVPGPDGWRLRVVPNKFPAVRGDTGTHEVVIASPRHVTDPTALTDDELALVFTAYRERLRALCHVGYVQAFQNVGAEAGASLGHLHSQILAMPFVPPPVRAELDAVQAAGRNLFLDSLDFDRLLATDDGFALVCPPAPRFAYETWLLPTRPAPRFEAITDAECLAVARLLGRFLRALDSAVGQPAYNWYLHTAPPGERAAFYQWHLVVIPRTARPAGFEWATGCFINPVPPDRAAERLRDRMPPV